VPSVTVEHQVVVGRQEPHPSPDRLTGQRIEDVGLEQMERQTLFVQARVQQAGQHVGSARRDADPVDGGVEHPADAGDGPLHPYLSGHRGDQVGAADQ
jgi:hypothetical protein